MTPSRRQFVTFASGIGVAAAAASAFPGSSAFAADSTTLRGADYAAKFTRPLPLPRRIDLTGFFRSATITARGASQQVLTGYPRTNCYGYEGIWPGPTIVVRRDRTARVTWRNALPKGSKTLAAGGHLLPVTPGLLEDDVKALPAGDIPMVPHLHGGHTEWQSDGHPEGWFTQTGNKGTTYAKSTYTYSNDQASAGLWYHDHTMGITRLNVGAGLAGTFLVRDEKEAGLIVRGVLPDPFHERELMIQDRSFTSDGQFAMPLGPNGQDALDFYGDFMCVNGIPWPTLKVEKRKYRFRVTNGCDSRFLVLKLDGGGDIVVVGSDQGLLPNAVSTPQLLVAPGERYDVVIDFTGSAGSTVTLLNVGVDNVLLGFEDSNGVQTNRATDLPMSFGPFDPTAPPGPPTPSTTPADPTSSGVVMQFVVGRTRSIIPNASVKAGTRLAGPLPALTATRTRGVMTAFVGGPGAPGGGMEMLGSLETGTAAWMDPVTEKVQLGTTEIWEIYNTGPVTHPIHLHLVNFAVLDRASFTFASDPTTMPDGTSGTMITVTGTGDRRAPEAWEAGRKDTVVCYPGEVTRVIANFDLAGQYVWHCHLLHHEDHGMMRPLTVA